MPFLKDRLASISDAASFERTAIEAFRWQYVHTPVYSDWCRQLGVEADRVHRLEDIPFLPISFFKSHSVIQNDATVHKRFLSSGTQGPRSAHSLTKEALEVYQTFSRKAFELLFGPIKNRPILALLPHYLQNGDSSLVEMCRLWMEDSGHEGNGFFLDDQKQLIQRLLDLRGCRPAPLLIGASYALLDLASYGPMKLDHVLVMETGGMKGRGKERVRAELHQELRSTLGADLIHSEYGMTELLSQAYAKGDHGFVCPPWMKLRIRDARNPLDTTDSKKRGCINVIDLANWHSCCFIATDDIGEKRKEGVAVLGRMDRSDIRGCNLLVV